MVAVFVMALFPNPRPLAFELWEQRNLAIRLCMLLFAIVIPAGMAEIWFYRIVFTKSGIERRNKSLKSEFKDYSEIEAVEFRPSSIFQPASLTITFSDVRTIRITDGFANLRYVDEILETYGNKRIMTTRKELQD